MADGTKYYVNSGPGGLNPKQCVAEAPEHMAMSLGCPSSQVIASVVSALYGTPHGGCDSVFTPDTACNLLNASDLIAEACVGQSSCIVVPGRPMFPDPCPGIAKYLDVKVACGPANSSRQTVLRSTWKSAVGPYLADDPFKGTTTNWSFFSQPTELTAAKYAGAYEGNIVSLMIPPAQAAETVAAVSVKQLPNGNYVYDFGQNSKLLLELAKERCIDATPFSVAFLSDPFFVLFQPAGAQWLGLWP